MPAGRLVRQRLVEQRRGARGVAGGELVVDRGQRAPAGGLRRSSGGVSRRACAISSAAAAGLPREDAAVAAASTTRGDTLVGRFGGERQMTGPLLQPADHLGQAPVDVPLARPPDARS